MIKWFLLAPALLLAAISLAHSQPAAPPASAQAPVVTYCWNGSALAVCGSLGGAIGTYLNGSAALSTTSAQVFAATARVRIKLINNTGVGSAGGTGIVVWCRWGSAAVAGGLGSFAVQSNGGGIDDQGNGVNQGSLNCIAESGTPSIYAEQY